MAIIRPTEKLWRSLGGNGALPAMDSDRSSNHLSEWLARPAMVGRRKKVLFGHPGTLLTVLVPHGRLEKVIVSFREALERELVRIDISKDMIAREFAALATTSATIGGTTLSSRI